jgi:dipeptidyl aminopeptidase/acylaminoacyl peptidase
VWYVSEADGFSHLYTIAPDGSGKQQLTRGRWEVRDVALSPDERSFYLHTNEISPFEQQLYRMSTVGGPMEKITSRSGKHVGVVSPDGRLVADVYSYVNRPPDLFLLEAKPGAEMSRLTTSPSSEWLSFPWIVPEIVMIPASDGVHVPAHIYKPADMHAQSNGAAVIFVHGAGYLHNVGNFWSEYPREYMFNQFLASKGYVVLDLDYRGSDGYGRDWRTAIYRHMGGRDLQDQVDASKYLTTTYHIGPERIGLYGGSYGGFITLMALFTEPKYFGAGAALRSVTDWAHYNQGYTSDILNLPQNDTLAYRQSSPIYFAEGLEDPLLMAHGMVDTNVHFQDIVRLTERLIELGKTRWELAVYPVESHGFVQPSSWTDEYRRIFELFQRYLPNGTSN